MNPWPAHRTRAEQLRGRYPFAAEVLSCYLALVDVWEGVGGGAPREGLAAWAAERVVPGVVKATEAAGPEPLAVAVREVDVERALHGWLAGADLPPVERYLARAALTAPLVALGDAAGAVCAEARLLASASLVPRSDVGSGDPSPRDQRHCPRCGGLPQFSVRTDGQDRLVRGGRELACARCGQRWAYSSSACPSCGETSGGKRTVYSEAHAGPIIDNRSEATFPHLRIDACAGCERYLIDIDLGRDNRAVPEVDELVALPLDLYAAEQGLSKITPNLMGY
jgi:hypothetical protein